jgi:hypothetical protein
VPPRPWVNDTPLSKFKTVQQAFGYLQKLGHTKGGQEQDEAISNLKKMGYTTGFRI